MPGELASAHAKLEAECDKCHARFDKEAQSELCLDCHTAIAADVAARSGFHGHDRSAQASSCKACHAEHKGRAAMLVHLETSHFDHHDTDVILTGQHQGQACVGCHPAGRRYRDAPHDCASCHAVDDPHGKSLGGDCAQCHSERSWSVTSFDHAATEFPLTGRHAGATCAGCHATRAFRGAPQRCVACHATRDRHRGGLGEECASCHTPAAWAGVKFDHARRTRFPLLGRHSAVACDLCHRPGTSPSALATTCVSCHATKDHHGGALGRDCERCHTPSDWRAARFRHDRETRFPLRGRHESARCSACHPAGKGDGSPSRDCVSCHRRDDVHQGREGTQCSSCHDESGWGRGVLFDHAATRFPLVGAHVHTACTKCHPSRQFKNVGRECVSCHAADDKHNGKSGSRCEECHSQATWVVRTPGPR